MEPEEPPNDVATLIADQINASRPAFIEVTQPLKQQQSVVGGWHMTWLSKGAEISFEISNDGEVWAFVGNVERHFRWQVEDYQDIWVHVSSHLHNYQRW
jgi:hypothetical protein